MSAMLDRPMTVTGRPVPGSMKAVAGVTLMIDNVSNNAALGLVMLSASPSLPSPLPPYPLSTIRLRTTSSSTLKNSVRL